MVRWQNSSLSKDKTAIALKVKELGLPENLVKSLCHAYKVPSNEKQDLDLLINYLSVEELREIYDSYKYAGSVSSYLLYINSLQDLDLQSALQKVVNIIQKKLKTGEYEYRSFSNEVADSKAFILLKLPLGLMYGEDPETGRPAAISFFDKVIIVIRKEFPEFIEVRAKAEKSLNTVKKLLCGLYSHSDKIDIRTTDGRFLNEFNKILEGVSSGGLFLFSQNVPTRIGIAARNFTEDINDIRQLPMYKKYIEENGAIETHHYGKLKDTPISFGFNYENAHYYTRRFTSEYEIDEIVRVIVHVAKKTGVVEKRPLLSSFLGLSPRSDDKEEK